MWQQINGSVVNALTVAAGTSAGLFMSHRLPERYQRIILSTLGLMTITLGIDAAVLNFSETVGQYRMRVASPETYGARLAMIMIGALVVGSIAGTWLRLHERIEAAGTWVHLQFSARRAARSRSTEPAGTAAPSMLDASPVGAARFAEGFLTASVIFCVGPLTLLGCLRNGAQGDPGYLYIKSVLDGFCSMALASTLGWGVMLSVVTILVFQGGLSLLAFYFADPLPDVSLRMMTAVGGVLMLGTAMMILDLKKIPVANMLPGLFLPPAMIWVVEQLRPGLLLPATG